MTALYPVFLKLEGLPVVVVGGGLVAAGKLDGLMTAGARVTVVAPQITQAIKARTDVSLVEREFIASDLDGARWVVAAAPPEINQQVAAAATARGLFVNAVDDTASATAYLGGVVRRHSRAAATATATATATVDGAGDGDSARTPSDGAVVEIAISTRGVAPALAGLLREALDALLPDDLESWIEVAKSERIAWKRAGIPMAQRRPLLLAALNRIYAPAEDKRPFLLRAIDRLYPNGWSA